MVSSRQWFIRTLEFREELLERGRQLRWHPAYMGARYASWVEGLNGDWSLSRQRFFGVPFPVWYRLDEEGNPDHEHLLVADEARLPVDPSSDVPDGFTQDQRGKPGGFVGDPDIMDTWATSSLTPQIAGGWVEDDDLFARVFPMDLRPQAHEIIRTWLFYTVLKSHLEHGVLPWTDAAISGFVLDPERKKMSKSKGNVVTPAEHLENHGADAVRYWSASARLGTDAVRRAADQGGPPPGDQDPERVPLRADARTRGERDHRGARPLDAGSARRRDRAGNGRPRGLRARPRARSDRTILLGLHRRLPRTRQGRAYGSVGSGAAGSAIGALRLALSVLLRLFAPFLPYVTDEVWSWWREGSIHRAEWPDPKELEAASADPAEYEVAAWALGEIRKTKALAKRSLRTDVDLVVVRETPEHLTFLRGVERDVAEAGKVRSFEYVEATEPSVEVRLAPED